LEKNKVINKATVELEFCDGIKIVESNTTEAQAIKLVLEKTQDCDFVLVGHKIKYTVRILNECEVELHDVIFKDILDDCVEFVEGSFEIDGEVKTPEVEEGILKFIFPVLEKEETVITFEVEATDDCCCKPKPKPVKSDPPTIASVRTNSTHVAGTGIAYATVYVTFPGEYIESYVVNNGGNWNAKMPDGYTPMIGDIIFSIQVEPGKDPSLPVETVVY